MKITSLRFGFATNSSSSHSIIIGNEVNWPKEKIVNNYKGEEGEVFFAGGSHSSLHDIVNGILLFLLQYNKEFNEKVLSKGRTKSGRYFVWNHDGYDDAIDSLTISDDFKEVLKATSCFLWQQGGWSEVDNGVDVIYYKVERYWEKELLSLKEKFPWLHPSPNDSVEDIEQMFWFLATTTETISYEYS